MRVREDFITNNPDYPVLEVFRSRKVDFLDPVFTKLSRMALEKYGDVSRISISRVINASIEHTYKHFLEEGWIK